MDDKTRFVVCALGIFFCYFYFAILQEQITRGKYGDEENREPFTYALTLVGVQCLCNWIFAKGMLIAQPQKEDKTPVFYYLSSALTYLLAMITSNMALQWVPYPTQVVGKSAKPIPVMVLGVLIGNKRYDLKKYICIVTIVIGVALFMYKDGKTSSVNEETVGLGELLLFLSLSMDGLTGAIQDRMRAASSPSGKQMMLGMNGWSAIMTAIALMVTGEFFQFLKFAARYPYVWINLGMLALTGALGQLFIFMMVAGFGPLSCSVVTTTRKFFTVLCSVILFGNVLVTRQWYGAVLVFAGLFADMFMGKKHQPVKRSVEKENEKLIS
ncbi:Solute carrier family 35 member B1 like [Pseudolycoriella hygida]|uniref:Solute carrier family 35 member B1 like n=1 Tax=Pseudolycoriella hygida TaxID=35572 RepID=A0A9Q0RTM8_9DIPT|nr:Solute carrier family 35 member B1 like [Pseudolycoriella hygida]